MFNCDKCNHKFENTPAHINEGKWCSYCASKLLCDNQECKECFEKSFASHPNSKFWSDDNNLKSRNVFKNCNSKFYFNCNKCNNTFHAKLANINKCNSWCPFCKSKTELKLFNWLKENNFIVKREVVFKWSQNKRYDFIIESLKLIIELDGRQHFKQVSNWQSPEKTQINDILKNKLANYNGYNIIRICQQIVWNDNEDWKNQLKNAIIDNIKYIEIGKIYEKLL